MAKRGIKVREHEDLSPGNVQRVIDALNSEKPITKKVACEMLNISYNTTRLNKIIEDYVGKLEYAKKRKKQLRNAPIDTTDKQFIIQEYLGGMSISEIAESLFRSPSVVKNVLRTYNLPIRNHKVTYENPVFIDDNAIGEHYHNGDLVFCARYNAPGLIDKLVQDSDVHGEVYRIWILGGSNAYVHQPYYELADLRKVQQELDIKIHDYDTYEIRELIAEGFRKAKMKMKRTTDD